MKFCQKKTIEQTAQLIANANSFAIFLHTRPDGDTIGASVALYLALKKLNKKAGLFCDCEIPANLLQFEHTKHIKQQIDRKYDMHIAVDCADLNRLGEFSEFFSKQKNTLTIDHHKNDLFSQNNCIFDYSSTCQIVYEVLQQLKIQLDCDIATYLFMGLCTDTGNFMHSNTDKNSFQMAADLLEFGVDNQKISRIFFKNTSLAKTRLLAATLSRLRTYFDDRLVLLYITQDDLKKYNLDDTATEGVVQYAINIDSAEVGVCLCQHSENSYKVSMRGKTIDVGEICQIFGGGGHKLAAGCMICGFFEDVVCKIEKAVGDALV